MGRLKCEMVYYVIMSESGTKTDNLGKEDTLLLRIAYTICTSNKRYINKIVCLYILRILS